MRIKLLLVLLLLIAGCKKDSRLADLTKWKISMDREDKRPYGTYLAYKTLPYYFPDAEIVPIGRSTSLTDVTGLGTIGNDNSRAVMILAGMYLHVSDEEWSVLKTFVDNGNELVISCSTLDSKIEQFLEISENGSWEEERWVDNESLKKSNKDMLSLVAEPQRKYGYKGRSLAGYISIKEGAAARFDTLGYTRENPNILRVRWGRGHITIHAAPLAWSNYFLLQPGNTDYLTGLLQTLPGNVYRVYWCDHYLRSEQSSGLGVLWRHPATKLAMQLGLLALLVYILFEGKRKQRIIPVIPPLKNDSVSFAETVGRLYFNKGDHANLAMKMTQQFLEWVRNNYQVNTNLLDEHFVRQVAMRSGQSEAMVSSLADMLREVRSGSYKAIDDAYLYQLYNTTQQFYKTHRT